MPTNLGRLMKDQHKPIDILLADDDEEDRMLACDALAESRLSNDIACVTDGEDLMDYLYRRGKYAPPFDAPRPGLILLDLNMPKKDGREALREIKTDPDLRQIPVVVLTTSRRPRRTSSAATTRARVHSSASP